VEGRSRRAFVDPVTTGFYQRRESIGSFSTGPDSSAGSAETLLPAVEIAHAAATVHVTATAIASIFNRLARMACPHGAILSDCVPY